MMRTKMLGVIAVCALLPLLPGGCAIKHATVDGAAHNGARLIASMADEQAALGIERQHTIYPSLFIPGTAELNELGRRDLTILAKSFGRHPGELGIWRAQTPQALYESRVNSVRSFLESHGVQVARMSFNETWPGGDGLGAESVAIRFLSSEAEVNQAKAPAGGESYGTPGSESNGAAGGQSNGAPGGQ